jgi:exonuclease III
MASANKPSHMRKLYGILKLKTDLILMSDVRVSNRSLVSSSKDLISIFRNNQYGSYTTFFNSSQNKRGVGILINNNLTFSEVDRREDREENYLLLKLRVRGNFLIVGAIYGPNDNNPDFFNNLEADVIALGAHPLILAGDWNTTYSNLPVNVNPDCLNMLNVPNIRHSNMLRVMCDNLSLCDPYRSLYPTGRDFSYCPRNIAAGNRSRIDFFLMSNSLLEICENCSISNSLQSTMFDHKAVILKLTGRRSPAPVNNISGKTVSDPDVNLLIRISIAECHVIYQNRDILVKNNLLRILGNARNTLRNAGPDRNFYNLDYPTGTGPDERRQLINQVVELLDSEDCSGILEYPVNIDHDVFFEMILNHVKNDLITYQIFLNRFIRKEKTELATLILNLSKNYDANFQDISVAERRLCKISEQEIEAALIQHPVFEFINGEKMSPHFLKLAKGCKSTGSLLQVVDDAGQRHANGTDCKNYITNYFEDIYKAPAWMPNDFTGIIEDFLGPDICNSTLVQDCMLANREAEFLDRELTLFELDAAAKECKTRSASGIDGFSNFFIKKYWSHFRIPLHNYANCCFRKGYLTDSFKTATMRLIPKKGDTTLIKNWRPISLLNCFYKVISRAINNRLKIFNDRFTSRAQKGFTTNRYLQEVILNIWQTSAYCKKNNISGAVVSVDLAKAFDTIFHGFVRAAYKFFGVSDGFLNMMDTLGTNRLSRIIFDDGSLSRPIKLETGRPQGDCPSPLQFNVGNQILLFRLELDPVISSVYSTAAVPRSLFPVDTLTIPINFRNESNCETDKTDGLADDTTVCTLMSRDCLSGLKTIMQEFETISGLKCNFDKTVILPIGTDPDPEVNPEEFGFKIVDKLTLLGFEINKDGPIIDDTFNKILLKIGKLITVWDRYRLSLPGRIGICKTLLISQLSFHGSILRPSKELIASIQDLINNFVTGPVKMAKNRLYLPSDKGGMGLINIDHFIAGLHCAWVKKAHGSSRDNWRGDMRSITLGNCLTLSPLCPDISNMPAIKMLSIDYENFKQKFYNMNDNYKHAFILHNTLFSTRNGRIISENVFRNNRPRLDMQRVSKLKFCDFFTGAVPKSLDELIADTGINFSLITYMQLMPFFEQFRQKIVHRIDSGSLETLEQFLSVKNGLAKKVRVLLDSRTGTGTGAGVTAVNELHTVKSFFRLIGINQFGDHVGKIFGIWNKSYLPNKIRDFAFKFYNNQLSINTRLSHYVRNRSRSCFFCSISGNADPDDESFLHLFSDCPTTSGIHNWFINKYFDILNRVPDPELSSRRKSFFFLGNLNDGVPYNELEHLMGLLVQFLIWEMKLNKKLLTGLTLDIDFRFVLKNCFRNCQRLSELKRGLPQEQQLKLSWTD